MAGGKYDKLAGKTRPGTYINFESARQDAHHPDGSGPGCLQCGARPQRLRRDQR